MHTHHVPSRATRTYVYSGIIVYLSRLRICNKSAVYKGRAAWYNDNIKRETDMTDEQHNDILTTLSDLLIKIYNLQQDGQKTINGRDIEGLYDDIAMIHDRINPEINQD